MIPISTLNANICRAPPNLWNKYILPSSKKNTLCDPGNAYYFRVIALKCRTEIFKGVWDGNVTLSFRLLFLRASLWMSASGVHNTVKKCYWWKLWVNKIQMCSLVWTMVSIGHTVCFMDQECWECILCNSFISRSELSLSSTLIFFIFNFLPLLVPREGLPKSSFSNLLYIKSCPA